MSQRDEFHNFIRPTEGLRRQLAAGLEAQTFVGDHATLSVVTFAPYSEGSLHHHPEEQWGVLVEGSATRVQGSDEIAVTKGDFWRTPGNVPHTIRTGSEGAKVLNFVSPPQWRRRSNNVGD